MNLPNKLTVLRIILTPVFLATMLIEFPMHNLVALILFIIASLTDYADGKISRKYNLITNFGKFLDPLADKMLTTAALLGFIKTNVCYGITAIVFIVLFREFLISSLRLTVVSSGENRVIAANIYGKAKTVSQMVAIITALSFSTLSNFSVNIPYTAIINTVLLWTSTLLCVISGIIYLSENKQFVDPSK